MNCKQCGALNNESSKFCSGCGTNLTRALPCVKCAKPLKLGVSFCDECGTKVNFSDNVNLSNESAEMMLSHTKQQNGNFDVFGKLFGHFNKHATEKWLFMILICIVYYVLSTWDADSHRYVNYSFIIFSTITLVFIPYLIILACFYDYKNEANPLWRGFYLTAQIVIPAYFVWNHETTTRLNVNSIEHIGFTIAFVGLIEAATLLIVKFSMKLRKSY